jgi:hypothetical protein
MGERFEKREKRNEKIEKRKKKKKVCAVKSGENVLSASLFSVLFSRFWPVSLHLTARSGSLG